MDKIDAECEVAVGTCEIVSQFVPCYAPTISLNSEIPVLHAQLPVAYIDLETNPGDVFAPLIQFGVWSLDDILM